MTDPYISCQAAAISRDTALLAWSNIPSDQNYRAAEAAQAALDEKLETLWDSLSDGQRAEVDARGVKRRALV